jgi:acetyltransferase-like isoleucine patch superfamily enzyme
VSATAAEVARFLEEIGQLEALVTVAGGDAASITLDGVAGDAEAGPRDLAWRRSPEPTSTGIGAGLLICPGPVPDPVTLVAGHAVAVCTTPRLAMAEVLELFFAELAGDREPVYAEPALAAIVAANHSWVKNATVGSRVRIAQHVVIGCSGMGYERDGDGRLVPFPQIGGVVLESDVDVAAHASIQRGALGDTLLCRGAKIGPHVNVGHSVEIGEDVLIAGHVQLGGGCRLGAEAVVWQSACVANGVTVGERAVVGMGACVRKDVGPGEVWAGNPARRLR